MQKNRNLLFIKLRDWNLNLYRKFLNNPAYLDVDEVFPEYKILEDNWLVIRDEINHIINNNISLPKFHDVDEGQEFISNNDGVSWNMFLIKTYGFWNKKNIKFCPKTVNLFKPFKNVESISVSILDPGKHIPAHNGPYKGILRYQLALSVPKDGSCVCFLLHVGNSARLHVWQGVSRRADMLYPPFGFTTERLMQRSTTRGDKINLIEIL